MKNPDHTYVHDFLHISASMHPDKIAVVHDTQKTTYKEIDQLVHAQASFLLSRNICPGDRVLLLCENCLEYIVTYYAASKTGGVIVPLSTAIKPHELHYILSELEPKALCLSKKHLPLLSEIRFSKHLQTLIVLSQEPKVAAHDTVESFSWSESVSYPDSKEFPQCFDENALASIIYTSGSTGTPKGVMLSHKNIVTNTHSICTYLQLTEHDIQMVVLPFFYVMGKSLLNTHIAVGGRVIINNSTLYPASILNQMVSEKVTGFSGVPSTYAYLLYRSPLEKYRGKLQHLRYCSQAGGHMAKKIKLELQRVLPAHTQIYIMYGATEASARLTYLEPAFFNDKIDSIGKPIPAVAISIRDSNGSEVPQGTIGEIVAQGDNIMHGYWNDAPATSGVLDQHGYHTGDMGYVDPDGFIYLAGRKDNVLKVSGHRIHTQEVEDGLMATGLLLEVIVVGLPDRFAGVQLACLAVPLNKDQPEKGVFMEVSKHLPRHKIPTFLYFVDALPKKINGKIDKQLSIELLESHKSSP